MGTYTNALICLNGHIVNSNSNGSPERNSNFCGKCGSETINTCQKCGALIKGKYKVQGVVDIRGINAPSYCYNCGNPYPWTEKTIKKLTETFELAEVSKTDIIEIMDTLPDIIASTPTTELSAYKINKIGSKFSGAASVAWAKVIRPLIVDISSETAKRIIKDGL